MVIMAMKILAVEDDPNLLQTLVYNLKREGYTALTASTGTDAVEVARRERPDLIILDLMLPEMSGLDVCRIVRQEMTVPILMLTARTEETDKIIGLELGADDYVTKPFSMRELLARVRSMLRRSAMDTPVQSEKASQVLQIGKITIDVLRHVVTREALTLELTPKEYDLLAFLATNKGLVFNREQLLEKVWGYEYAADTRTVDVHVRWLRQKIEDDSRHPIHLLTVRGTGYKLEG